MQKRVCKNPACGKPLVRRRGEAFAHFERRKGCSKACGAVVREPREKDEMAKRCPLCGGPISDRARACCRKCLGKAMEIGLVTSPLADQSSRKPCQRCGVEFGPDAGDLARTWPARKFCPGCRLSADVARELRRPDDKPRRKTVATIPWPDLSAHNLDLPDEPRWRGISDA